ncbi:MAG: choice-of-anchor J domain-containing protein, partial [Paludibacteraceae bacterium]|nr:choice-of-anchor J domain-containing protein [Paludibacteraceae bacterium]
MRKFTYFYSLLLTALFLLPWSGITAEQLVEGFETGVPPTDWSSQNVKGSPWTRAPKDGFVTVHGGSYYAKVAYASSGGADNYLITPQLRPAAGESLKFYLASQNYAGTTVTIEVSTTNTSTSAFTNVLATYASNTDISSSTYNTEQSVSLADYVDQDIYIAFHVVDNNGGNVYLDDVSGVSLKPDNCPKPTDLSYSNVTATSVDLTWTVGGTEGAWNVLYKATGDADWSTEQVTSNSHTLALTPAKHYEVKVQAVCGGGDESKFSSSVEFDTPCGVMPLPFSEDFSGNIDCWTKVACASNTGLYENNKFRFFYNTTPPQYLITPELTSSANEVKVEFNYYNYYGSETFKVGYSTTTNDISAFTWGEELTCSNTSSTSPSSYSENFPAGVKFVSIQYTSNDKYYLYIDNFSISEVIIPTCFVPTGLSTSAVTSNSAALSWTKGQESDDAWVVEYSTASDFSGSTELPATTNSSFPLSSLTPQTTYYVHVKTNCGANGYSEYCDAVSFTTPCAAITTAASWTEDFEGSTANVVPDCWEVKYSDPGNTYKPDVYTGTTAAYVHNGYQSLYMKAYDDSGYGFAVFPVINDAAITTLQLRFWHKEESASSSLELGYLTNVNDLSTYSTLLACTESTDWTEETADLSSLPSGARLAFRFLGSSSYSKYAAGIDDIRFTTPPTCFKPTLGDATNPTPEGATFSWTASGHGETQWQWKTSKEGSDWSLASTATSATVTGHAANTTYTFYVRSYCAADDQSEAASKSFKTAAVTAPTNVSVGSITTTGASASWTAGNTANYQWCVVAKDAAATWDQSASSNSATLSGLTANTPYDFYVRSYCAGNGAYAAATKVSFRTACDPTLVDATHPFTENFNSLTTSGQIPGCWNNDEGTTTTASYKWSYSTVGHEGKCVRFDSNNNYSGRTNVLASPVFDIEVDADLEFWVKNPTGGAYSVQISVDGGARTDLFTGLTGLSSWTKKEVILTSYVGHTIQLFFNGTSNYNTSTSYLYLDDFVITPQACRKPASDPVATEDDGTVTITWTAGGTNTDYQFSLVETGESPVWDDNNVVTALTKSFSNLLPLTTYDFYVRTYCDETNQSEERKVTFSTGCAAYETLPFEENFTGLADVTTPQCWDNSEGSITDQYQKWRSRGNSNLQFNSSTTTAGETSILATPTILLGEGNLLTFRYKNPTGGEFKVQIQGEGIAREDLLTEGLSGIADWTLKYATIPAKFNNKKVQLFFCATSNEGDMNAYISIDNIRVARGEIFEDVPDAASVSRLSALVTADETTDVITTRPMQFNGNYNTLCLPFDLNASQLADADCPLNNCELKIFDYAEEDNGELVVSITGASSIVAGTPYFFRYMGATESDRRAVLYKDVTISASEAGEKKDADEPVWYKGVFQTVTLYAEPTATDATHNVFFLSAANTLYWPAVDYTANAFRAYFYINPSSVSSIKKGMPLRFTESPRVP